MIEKHVVWLPQLKLAYFRIPKAANSSIRYILAKHQCLTSQRGLRPSNDAFWLEQDKAVAQLLTPTDFISDPEAVRSWSFTFVRNPLARLYSCWNNKVIENRGAMSRRFLNMGVTHGMSFEDFVDCVVASPDDACDIHVRSQVAILTLDGHVLPNFVGRVESIAPDWKHVRYEARIRNAPGLGTMQQRNVRKSVQSDIMFELSKTVRDKIMWRYRQDFEFFYPRSIRKMA